MDLIFWAVGIAVLLSIVLAVVQTGAQSRRDEAIQIAADGIRARLEAKFPEYSGKLFVGGDKLAMIINEEKRTTLVANGNGVAKEIPFSAYKSIEILTGGVSIAETTKKGGVTRALAGGLMLGGVGAVVGVLTAKEVQAIHQNITSIAVSLKIDDPHFPVVTWFTWQPFGIMTELKPHEVRPHMIEAVNFYNQFAPIFTLHADEDSGLVSI